MEVALAMSSGEASTGSCAVAGRVETRKKQRAAARVREFVIAVKIVPG
jgi:hypothetical protein